MNGVCIVGHTRTFHIHVVQRGFQDVLLPKFPGARVHGILFLDNPDAPISRFRFDPIAEPPKDVLRFDLVHRISKSTCTEYMKLTGHKMCKEGNVAWMQIAWVRACFSSLQRNTTVYVRARPDSLFVSMPAISVLPHQVITWEKRDAPVSDQFFVMGKTAYERWFKTFQPNGCCAEYDSAWMRHGSTQNKQILGCIVRSRHTLKCWKQNQSQVNLMTQHLLRSGDQVIRPNKKIVI